MTSLIFLLLLGSIMGLPHSENPDRHVPDLVDTLRNFHNDALHPDTIPRIVAADEEESDETTEGPDSESDETTDSESDETTNGPSNNFGNDALPPDTIPRVVAADEGSIESTTESNETTEAPDTESDETTEGPDVETTEGPDTESDETTEGPDVETTEGPDTESNETTEGPDVETTEGPDTESDETTEGPDTESDETTEGPDVETTEGPDLETSAGTTAPPSSDSDTIIFGNDADEDEYPFHILLYYKRNFRCGGSIVAVGTVLTAAHCVENDPKQRKGRFSIVAGIININDVESGQKIYAERIEMHENYDGFNNDVALIYLETDLYLSASVQPVPALSGKKFDKFATKSDNCYVTGFGARTDYPTYKDPKKLQELKMSFSSNKKCKKLLKNDYDIKDSVTKGMICSLDTHGTDCFGDSGGPIGCYDKNGVYTQVGIVSWGPTKKCLDPPSVFTRVSTYSKWIKARIN